MDELLKIPPVTRTLLAATAAVTLPVLLQLSSPYRIVFIWPLIAKRFEIWRLFTPFFFGGGGIPLIFDIFLLYRNSNDLEERHFQRRNADYVWALLTICSCILALNIPLKSVIFFHPLLVGLTHLWAQTNPTNQVSLFGLISMPAPYFPFAMIGIDLVSAGPGQALKSCTGLASAHLYYFLTEIYPRQNDGRAFPYFSTPQILINLFGNGAPPPGAPVGAEGTTYRAGGGWAFRPRNTGNTLGGSPGTRAAVRPAGGQAPVSMAGRGTTGTTATTSTASRGTTYRWGSGNRLGEE